MLLLTKYNVGMNKKKSPPKDRISSLERRLAVLEKRVRIMDQEVITRSRLRAAFKDAVEGRCLDPHVRRIFQDGILPAE